VQGLGTIQPELVCLHSIPSFMTEVDKVSCTVMKDIKYTTFEQAKALVNEGFAEPSDFWVFAGYAGWGPMQLMGELERNSWYMCATDSQTLLKELSNKSQLTSVKDAGLDTWQLLMNLIQRGSTAQESLGGFEDLMLKEWAREYLVSLEAGGNAGYRVQSTQVASGGQVMKGELIDSYRKRREKAALFDKTVSVGTLVRAGSNERSPFLLQKQEFHKSIVLIIADDDAISVGIILNQPSQKSFDVEVIDPNTRSKLQIQFPIRFGGMYSIQGQTSLIWLHDSTELKDASIGSPIASPTGIWKCTQNQAIYSIEKGFAKPNDFLVTTGLSVWMKDSTSDGIQAEVTQGNFEVISTGLYSKVWRKLQAQQVLSHVNLNPTITQGNEAWNAGSTMSDDAFDSQNFVKDSYVHNSNVRVDKLADDALKFWVATFLLGAPSLGTV